LDTYKISVNNLTILKVGKYYFWCAFLNKILLKKKKMAKVAENYYNIEKLTRIENFQIWKF